MLAIEEEDRMEEQAPKIESSIAYMREDIGDLRADIRGVRAELKGDVASLRAELKVDMTSLRTELREEAKSLRKDLSDITETLSNLRLEMYKSDLMTRIWMLLSLATVLGVMARGFKWM